MPVDPTPFPTPPLWERRFVAASIDTPLMALCCAGLLHSHGLLADAPRPIFAWPSAVVLGLMFAVEALTGVTPGKLGTGLTLRGRGGARPPVWRLVLRAVVKYLPVAVFVASLWADSLLLLLAAATLAIAYIPLCYLPIVRTGGTFFDMVAGTTLARRT